MVNSGMPAHLIYPVSADQVRELMGTIPSWVRILSKINDDTAFQDSDMDSLAFLEFVEELQNATGLEIPDDDAARVSTIAAHPIFE